MNETIILIVCLSPFSIAFYLMHRAIKKNERYNAREFNRGYNHCSARIAQGESTVWLKRAVEQGLRPTEYAEGWLKRLEEDE